MQSIFDESQIQQIRNDYINSGMSHQKLAEKYFCSKTTITRCLKGVFEVAKREWLARLIKDHESGLSYEKLAAKYGIDKTTVSRYFRNMKG